MNIGDKIKCRRPEGYQFTKGKEYEVIGYTPETWDAEARFTWPAYVSVRDDNGREVTAHASRFTTTEG